jgi:hypothetical protein
MQNEMEIKPVKLKRIPGYPTIRAFVDNPQDLSKHVPVSWMKNKYAATTLATFILCGCSSQGGGSKGKQEAVVSVGSCTRQKNAGDVEAAKQDPVKIARIFSHGDGSGAIGCVVMSPPVFISEDDARKIIFAALKAENIEFDTNNCPVLKFKAPPLANECYGDTPGKTDAKVEIKMDG